MKSTAVNRLLAMLLVAALAFSGAIPISAKGSGNKSSFAAKDGSGHTVYWSYGITPPKLPEGAESGAFGVAFDPEGGWFDLDLGEKDRRDGAAAAANLLHWWLNLNSSSIDRYLKKVPGQPEEYAGKLGDPQGVKAYLTAPNTQAPADSPLFGWMDSKGGKDSFAPDAYMDSFILGYPMNKKQNTPDDFHPEKEDGGFFFPVFDMITLTQQEKKLDNFQKTGKVIQSVLEERCGLILGVKDNKGNPGYLNLWGVEFDGDGAFTAVYVTDPANNAAGDDSLIRYSVFANDKKQIRMSDLGGKDEKGLVWDTLYILYAGADGFAGYLGDEYPDYGIPELDFGENDEEKPEDVPEDQKQWEPATYHWTEDHSQCQAVRTEKNTREIQPAEGTVTSQQTKAPTDTRAGVMTYTATFDADWAEKQVKNVPIPAIETEWGQVRYEWAADHQTC